MGRLTHHVGTAIGVQTQPAIQIGQLSPLGGRAIGRLGSPRGTITQSGSGRGTQRLLDRGGNRSGGCFANQDPTVHHARTSAQVADIVGHEGRRTGR
jgi:hypothetical protein